MTYREWEGHWLPSQASEAPSYTTSPDPTSSARREHCAPCHPQSHVLSLGRLQSLALLWINKILETSVVLVDTGCPPWVSQAPWNWQRRHWGFWITQLGTTPVPPLSMSPVPTVGIKITNVVGQLATWFFPRECNCLACELWKTWLEFGKPPSEKHSWLSKFPRI